MNEAYIRFLAPVIPETTDRLFKIIDQKIGSGVKRIHLLISSPGGSVFHGLSIYNYLKGAPIEVYTYNFGSVDSIGVIIFCAGKKRYSVPHARFLIHGVRFNINGNIALDEKELDSLNRIVTMYLDYAELQAQRGIIMYMNDWVEKLDAFLQFNEKEILKDNGQVSHKVAEKLALGEYEKYRVAQDKIHISDFDREVKKLLKK